jgi:hypothetical protein
MTEGLMAPLRVKGQGSRGWALGQPRRQRGEGDGVEDLLLALAVDEGLHDLVAGAIAVDVA